MRILITGIAGFIGSHLADHFINKGDEVYGIDNFLTGSTNNVNKDAVVYNADIREKEHILQIFREVRPTWVFHEAAIARTPWTIDDPQLHHDTNITGTFNVLMAAKEVGVKKVVMASSNVVYGANTPYRAGKLMLEHYGEVFTDMYNLPTVSLRYSNAYGSLRQSEQGPSINCIASLRKSKREDGYIWITGDGKQTRDFTHVEDLCRANELAALSDKTGIFDICTGTSHSLNEIAEYFDCPVKYIPDRKGDVKHIPQDPARAEKELGFKFSIPFEEGIKVYL